MNKGTKILEMVLKADEMGTLEAAIDTLKKIDVPVAKIHIISKGVGPVNRSDILMAQTGGKLVVGFNSGITPRLKNHATDLGVEVRLYQVIYKLKEDIEDICLQLGGEGAGENIHGSAKIIATFKAAKGMIIGCEITEGKIIADKLLRVITPAGKSYTGKVVSLQIEKKPVSQGKAGDKVGIHLPDWKKAKVGDWVECFERLSGKKNPWKPRPGIYNY